MLSKRICKKCYEAHGIPWEDGYSGIYPEEAWAQRKVLCPITEKIWNGRPDDMPIFVDYFPINEIPKDCKFFLEHQLSAK